MPNLFNGGFVRNLYIIRGIPGSGKSTLAQNMYDYGMVKAYFEADMFMTDDQGNYKFDPARLGYCHQMCQNNVEWHMREGFNVAVSNTFTTEKEMQPYLDMAKTYGYTVHVLIVENRHGGINQHNVPAEKITMMCDRLRNSIKL